MISDLTWKFHLQPCAAVLACDNCHVAIPAEHLADADGERLFGCCSCGVAKVEYDFGCDFVGQRSSSLADVTDTAAGNPAAPLSFG